MQTLLQIERKCGRIGCDFSPPRQSWLLDPTGPVTEFIRVLFLYAAHYKAHHGNWLKEVQMGRPKMFTQGCALPEFEIKQYVLPGIADPFDTESDSEDASVMPAQRRRIGST